LRRALLAVQAPRPLCSDRAWAPLARRATLRAAPLARIPAFTSAHSLDTALSRLLCSAVLDADLPLRLYDALMREGVLVAKKDFNAPKHHELDMPNLHVIKTCQSLTSKGFLKTQFSWNYVRRTVQRCPADLRQYYYTLVRSLTIVSI